MYRVVGIPLDLLTTPRDGDVMTNRWWVIENGGALFWQSNKGRAWSPQCNSDRRITERLTHILYPQATVEYIPTAYVGRWDDYWGHTLTPELLDAAVITYGDKGNVG